MLCKRLETSKVLNTENSVVMQNREKQPAQLVTEMLRYTLKNEIAQKPLTSKARACARLLHGAVDYPGMQGYVHRLSKFGVSRRKRDGTAPVLCTPRPLWAPGASSHL